MYKVQKDKVQSTKVESGEKFFAQGLNLKVWEVGPLCCWKLESSSIIYHLFIYAVYRN